MSGDKDVMPGTETASSTGSRTWVLAVFVLAITTWLFNTRVVAHLDRPRSVAPSVEKRYDKLLYQNDTDNFLRYQETSAEALRQGKLYVPLGDFDCPVTYLMPTGAASGFTRMSPLVAHNLFFLFVCFLNGLTAYAFLRSLGCATPWALMGAVTYQGSNYVLMCHFMGHMNNVQVQWIPLIFLGVAESMRPGARWGWSLLLGAALALQVLSSPYYTLYLGFVTLPVFVLVYIVSDLRYSERTGWDLLGSIARLGLAACFAVLLSSFYLLGRLGSPSRTFVPPRGRQYSFDHYLEWLEPSDPALFIGLPTLVIAVLALRWWYLNRRPITTAMVATGVSALLMMFPALPGTPYWLFHRYVPFFNRMRVPLRFFPIFFLMLIALDMVYLSEVYRRLSRGHRLALLLVALAAFLAFNWLASPWPLDFQLVTILKTIFKRPIE